MYVSVNNTVLNMSSSMLGMYHNITYLSDDEITSNIVTVTLVSVFMALFIFSLCFYCLFCKL